MNRPAVFFDRDNTLIACNDYLGDPAGVSLVAGAAEVVARVRRLGFAAVIFSNQSGVARGMFSEAAVRAVNHRLDEMLRQADPEAAIDRHEYCPFHPDGSVAAYRKESNLRKPRPGMLFRAAEALGLDLSRSWAVGDAPRDIEAGKAAGCRTILLKDASLKASPAAGAASAVAPDFVVSSLREAGEVIERESKESGLNVAPAEAAPSASAPSTTSPTPVPSAEIAEPVAKKAPPEPIEEPAKRPARRQTAGTSAKPGSATERIEGLLEDVLDELRRREDVRTEFSITKLLAGIVQVIALAVFFLAYLRRDMPTLEATLLTAIAFETLAIALLIMERRA